MTLPGIPSTLTELLTNRAIPELDETAMSALCDHLFRTPETPIRLRVAEIAYRHHEHSNALNLFLACTMPIAQKWTERKAERMFVYPSDWQIECMYNGAVNALLGMFQRPLTLQPIHDTFRRLLYRCMLKGACAAYFSRDENCGVQAIGNVDRYSSRNPTTRTAEEQLVTRDLLEQIYQYPLLRRSLSKTLECIVEHLGPDLALRNNKTPENWKNMHKYRPMLNVQEIANARGIKPSVILKDLHLARVVIRKAFNGDGRLFLTH